MGKENYILMGIGVLVVLVILGIVFIVDSNSVKQGSISFSSSCKFDLIGGQFGGTQGGDSITCKFRNDGSQSAEKCFNVNEVKIDGSVETVISEHENICSGILEPYHTSEEKIIYEPQTYRVFEDNVCSSVSRNEDNWICTKNGRDIIFTIQID